MNLSVHPNVVFRNSEKKKVYLDSLASNSIFENRMLNLLNISLRNSKINEIIKIVVKIYYYLESLLSLIGEVNSNEQFQI